MIRLFVAFCKLNYKTLSAIDLFLKSMEEFTPANIPLIKLSCDPMSRIKKVKAERSELVSALTFFRRELQSSP
jgi:hypothetical protein